MQRMGEDGPRKLGAPSVMVYMWFWVTLSGAETMTQITVLGETKEKIFTGE